MIEKFKLEPVESSAWATKKDVEEVKEKVNEIIDVVNGGQKHSLRSGSGTVEGAKKVVEVHNIPGGLNGTNNRS